MALTSENAVVIDVAADDKSTVATGDVGKETFLKNLYIKHKNETRTPTTATPSGTDKTGTIVGQPCIDMYDVNANGRIKSYPIDATRSLIVSSFSEGSLGHTVAQIIEITDTNIGASKTYAPILLDAANNNSSQSWLFVKLSDTKLFVSMGSAHHYNLELHTDNSLSLRAAVTTTISGRSEFHGAARVDDNNIILSYKNGTALNVVQATLPDAASISAVGSPQTIYTAGTSNGFGRLVAANADNSEYVAASDDGGSAIRLVPFTWDGGTQTATVGTTYSWSTTTDADSWDMVPFFNDTYTYGVLAVNNRTSAPRDYAMLYNTSNPPVTGNMSTNGSNEPHYTLQYTGNAAAAGRPYANGSTTTNTDYFVRTGTTTLDDGEWEDSHIGYDRGACPVGNQGYMYYASRLNGIGLFQFTGGARTTIKSYGSAFFSYGMGRPQGGRWNTSVNGYIAICNPWAYILDANGAVTMSCAFNPASYQGNVADISPDGSTLILCGYNSSNWSSTSGQMRANSFSVTGGTGQQSTGTAHNNLNGYSAMTVMDVIALSSTSFVIGSMMYNAGTYYKGIGQYTIGTAAANDYTTSTTSTGLADICCMIGIVRHGGGYKWFTNQTSNYPEEREFTSTFSNVTSRATYTTAVSGYQFMVAVGHDGGNDYVVSAAGTGYRQDGGDFTLLVTDQEPKYFPTAIGYEGGFTWGYVNDVDNEFNYGITTFEGGNVYTGSQTGFTSHTTNHGSYYIGPGSPSIGDYYLNLDDTRTKITAPGNVNCTFDLYVTYGGGASDFLLYADYPITKGQLVQLEEVLVIPENESVKIQASVKWQLDVYSVKMEK